MLAGVEKLGKFRPGYNILIRAVSISRVGELQNAFEDELDNDMLTLHQNRARSVSSDQRTDGTMLNKREGMLVSYCSILARSSSHAQQITISPSLLEPFNT